MQTTNGFVQGPNEVDAVVEFVKDTINALDGTLKTVGVFLDLQNAFDCLLHSSYVTSRPHSTG